MAAGLFFAGVRLYLFGIAGVALAIGTAVLAVTSPNRMCRILPDWADGSDWLGPGTTSPPTALLD